ncbi:MAG: phytanoyl-CoA dioxygenase family protein [Pseudomonadota bacterium]
MKPAPEPSATFRREGRLWLRGALSGRCLAALDLLGAVTGKPGQRVQASAGLNAALGPDSPLTRTLSDLFGTATTTRVVSFDKSADANWGVGWHRDRIIAVRDRADMPGFDNWSCKAGQWHCRPPQSVLDTMLFCRLFLDPVSSETGGMEYVPCSHLGNDTAPTETEDAIRGDVLVLHMNTLHRSRPALSPASRRVLRVDFATAALPAPLAWATPAAVRPETGEGT